MTEVLLPDAKSPLEHRGDDQHQRQIGDQRWVRRSPTYAIRRRWPLRDWARLMASAGWNALCPSEVNWDYRDNFLEHLDEVKTLARILRDYGLKLYWSPSYLLALEKETADQLYARVPDFGGYVLKLGSEKQNGDPVRGEEFLPFFNFVSLDYRLSCGRTVCQDFYANLDEALRRAGQMPELWSRLKGQVDDRRFQYTLDTLNRFIKTAQKQRSEMIQSFETVTGRKYEDTIAALAASRSAAEPVVNGPKSSQ